METPEKTTLRKALVSSVRFIERLCPSKALILVVRQTEEASIGHRKRALPHHPLVSTKSVSTHQAIGFKTQNNILKHEVSLEQDIDESHRAADAGIWAQMGMPQDGPTRKFITSIRKNLYSLV